MERKTTELFVRMKIKGVTQKTLANDLGIDQATVSKIANGLVNPTPEVRKRLYARFRCGDELFQPVALKKRTRKGKAAFQ